MLLASARAFLRADKVAPMILAAADSNGMKPRLGSERRRLA